MEILATWPCVSKCFSLSIEFYNKLITAERKALSFRPHIPSLDVCDEQDSPTKAMTAAADNGHVEDVRLLAEVQWADSNVLDNGDELV